MTIAVEFMRNQASDPYRFAVTMRPSRREPATIDSWHDTRKEANERATELRSIHRIPFKIRQFAMELFH